MTSFSTMWSVLLASPVQLLCFSKWVLCFAFLVLFHRALLSVNEATENTKPYCGFLIYQILERARKHMADLQIEEMLFLKLCPCFIVLEASCAKALYYSQTRKNTRKLTSGCCKKLGRQRELLRIWNKLSNPESQEMIEKENKNY